MLGRLTISLLLLINATEPILGCSCAPSPTGCEAYGKSEAVALVRVLSFQDGTLGDKRSQLAVAAVKEAWRGIEPQMRSILVDFGAGSMCDYVLGIGEEHLMFGRILQRNGKMILQTDACMGNLNLAHEFTTFGGLKRLRELRNLTLIGYIFEAYDDASSIRPLAGVTVIAQKGERSYRTFSDARGQYEIPLSMEGNYFVYALHRGHSREPRILHSSHIDVKDGGCNIKHLFLRRVRK